MQEIKRIKDLACEYRKVRSKIRKAENYAYRLSLEDLQDLSNNPFRDEANTLKLQELSLLQEIQYLKRQLRPSLSFFSVFPLFLVCRAA